MKHPTIGIPAYTDSHDEGELVVRRAYTAALYAAGATPVLLPPTQDEQALAQLYALCDGLLLSGGGDLATASYGAADSGKLTSVDVERDAFECDLARRALHGGKPLLGICRGIQALNVAAGGTLIQDIPSETATKLLHATPPGMPRGYSAHTIDVVPNSLLAEALGLDDPALLTQLPVNSWHHQAVLDVAPGFTVVAHAPDGIIEAIEWPQRKEAFVLGVQWHPEGMVPDSAPMTALFCAFVAACHR